MHYLFVVISTVLCSKYRYRSGLYTELHLGLGLATQKGHARASDCQRWAIRAYMTYSTKPRSVVAS
jgi:hypothetical protein